MRIDPTSTAGAVVVVVVVDVVVVEAVVVGLVGASVAATSGAVDGVVVAVASDGEAMSLVAGPTTPTDSEGASASGSSPPSAASASSAAPMTVAAITARARGAGRRLPSGSMSPSIRIGYQLSGNAGENPTAAAQRAEQLGFDVITVSDHVGPGLSPMPTLAAMAAVTEAIRLGTMVLNNDMRNPVQLAWESATIDRLSGGRFELGLGAGHTPQEYDQTGIERSDPAVRKARLAESVEIIRRLLDGETVDVDGEHYRVEGASIDAAVQDRLPILVGGNGERLLAHAGAHADIVGLQGLHRTLADGHRHTVKWSADRVTEQVEQVRAGAGERADAVEFSALVQVVAITDDRQLALEDLCDRVDGLSPEDAAAIPYALVGSVEEIVEHLYACQDRWGIDYFVVRELDAFAPVLEVLRSR